MQKGGRVTYNHEKKKWLGDSNYSNKEADALNLLSFKPEIITTTGITSGVYRRISLHNINYNNSLYALFDQLDEKNKIKVVVLLKEAYNLRIQKSKKIKKPDTGHTGYEESLQSSVYSFSSRNPVGSPNRKHFVNLNPPGVTLFKRTYSKYNPKLMRHTSKRIKYEENEIEGLSELIENLEEKLQIYERNYSENASKKTRKRRKIRKIRKRRKRRDTRRENKEKKERKRK